MQATSPEQLTLFAAATLASPSASPGSDRARMTTAISGRKLLDCYASLMPPIESPLGACLKMLLDTSEWASTKCWLNWKARATPHGRLLFQLAPSMPRTAGIECGLLPTVHSSCSTGPVSAGRDGGLNIQTAVALLPTCRARMTGDISENRKSDVNLNLESALSIALLPTPRANKHSPQSREDFIPNLAARVEGLIPTLAARDYRGAFSKAHVGHMDQLPNAIAHGTNHGLKLQPAFVEWMMGFPENWTELHDLKPSETP